MAVIEATPLEDIDDMLLTPQEVAGTLRKTVQTLANERARGEGLPYVRVGGRILYRSDDVLEAINVGTTGFTWRRLEGALRRYGLEGKELAKLMRHLQAEL